MSNPDTFCILPWVHLYGSVDGIWGRCCVDATTYPGGASPQKLRSDALGCSAHSSHVLANEGRRMDLLAAFNSIAMKETRLAMLDGLRLDACQYCYARERAGARSYRQIANDLFPLDGTVRELVESTSDDGHLNGFPRYLDIRLENACGLACIMCDYPVSSTIGVKQGMSPRAARLDTYAQDEELWAILEANAHHIERVYFAGGEPLQQRMHLRFLDLLIARGRPEHTTLAYSTNLMLIPDGWLERLKRFRSIDIGASCDGIGEVFERIRLGARWETFARNVRRVRAEFPVRLAVTVQRDNAAHLEELIQWAVLEHCELDMSNLLLHPEELCVTSLPIVDRETLARQYDQSAARYMTSGLRGIAEQLESLASILRAQGHALE